MKPKDFIKILDTEWSVRVHELDDDPIKCYIVLLIEYNHPLMSFTYNKETKIFTVYHNKMDLIVGKIDPTDNIDIVKEYIRKTTKSYKEEFIRNTLS